MKNCWIIGASAGIGASLAQKYQENGFNLILSARDEEKLNSLKNDLNSEQILVEKLDVSDVNSIAKAQENILKNFNKIDLVILCSALYEPMSVTDFDLDLAKKINDVNFNGFINLLKIITPHMKQNSDGQIAVIASVAGYMGLPNSFAYGASKAAIINLCEGIYSELKKDNIALSVINPGFVKTRLTDKNNFKMPFIISSKKAADEIFNGLKKKKFEIHFPKRFTILLKILRLLPYKIFFHLTSKL